jgi:2-dehydro-3-deoxygalactonokinase
MRWTDGFIAVDWGTTNRRAYRIDGRGECSDSFEDGRGVLSVEANEFPGAAAEIRERLGDLPLLLAGMVGSTRGWVEAPYVPCPASLGDLAERLIWIEPGIIAIVPGLSILGEGRADVMRGEEVQLFGAIASGLIPETCFVGHPGTHNKWVRVRNGRITDFRTVMTGELFAMLRDRGILAEMLGGEVSLGDSFREGARRGLTAPVLTAELFSVRAGVLLGAMDRESAPSYVSGLLIGADVGVGLEIAEGAEMIMMGDSDLTRLYAAAAQAGGHAAREIAGEAAFLAGAAALAGSIR